jgi:hypothetical protein
VTDPDGTRKLRDSQRIHSDGPLERTEQIAIIEAPGGGNPKLVLSKLLRFIEKSL